MGAINLPTEEEYDDYEDRGLHSPDTVLDTSTGLSPRLPGTEVRRPVDITKGITAKVPKVSALEASTGTTTGKAVGSFLYGINDMIVGLPDMVLNGVMEGLEKIGLVPENERSRDYLLRIFNAGDYETVKTIIPYLLSFGQGEKVGSTGAYEYARAIGAGIGAAVPFIGAAGRVAHTARAMPGLMAKETADLLKDPRWLPILQQSMVRPYVKGPGAAVSIEGTFAALSGAGAVAEKDIFGTQTGGGALAPVLAPAVLAKVLASAWTYSPLRRTGSWLTRNIYETAKAGEKNTEVVKTAVGRELAEAYNTAEAKANAAKALELESIVLKDSDAFLTVGEKTKNPVQLAREKALAQGGDDSYRISLLDRRHQIYDAMRKFYHNVVLQGNDPAGTDTPMFIQDKVSGRINPLLKKVRSDQNEVADSIAVASAAEGDTALFPSLQTGTRAERGATIRQAIEGLYKTATARAGAYAEKLGINSANEVADPTAFRNAQTSFKAAGQYSKEDISYQRLPGSVKDFLKHKESLTFQDWKRFRDQVGDDIGSALAKGQATAVKSLIQLKSTLDNFGTEYGKINKDFQKFNEYYQQNVVLPFQNNTVSTVRAGSGAGSQRIYQVRDEDVASYFLGSKQDADSYVKLFGNDKLKMEAVRAAALDKIRLGGGLNEAGVLNPTRINNWINKNGDTLQSLGLLDEFKSSQQLLTNLSRRAATLKSRDEKITSNLVYKALLKSTGEGDPTKLLDAALTNVATMRGLRNTVLRMAREKKGLQGGPWGKANANSIQEAWNRSVIERFMFKKNIDLAADDGITSFATALQQNERALVAGIGRKQYQNLFVLSDLAARVQSSGKVRLAGTPATANMIENMTKAFGLSGQNISRSTLAWKEGRLSGRTLGVYFAGKAIGTVQQRRVQELWQKALSDPELANLLTKEGVNIGSAEKPVWRPRPADIKRLNAYLFNIGYPYGDTPGVDPENRPADTITIKAGPQPSAAPAPAPVQGAPAPAPVQGAPIPATGGPQSSIEPEQTSADILKQIVSVPSPGASNVPTGGAAENAQMAELFPFDATSAAIERRKTANQIPRGGIQQLAG